MSDISTLLRSDALPPYPLFGQAADHIEALEAAIAERDRLLDNLTITIGAIVVAAGGQVEVPQSVLEDIQSFELEKAPGRDGGIIYATRQNLEVQNGQE